MYCRTDFIVIELEKDTKLREVNRRNERKSAVHGGAVSKYFRRPQMSPIEIYLNPKSFRMNFPNYPYSSP